MTESAAKSASRRKPHIVVLQPVSLWDQLALSTYLRSFLEALGRCPEIDVTAIVAASQSGKSETPPGVRVLPLRIDVYSPASQLRFARLALRALRDLQRTRPIDVIHCLYPNSSMMAATVFRRKAPGTRILYDIRSPWIRTSLLKGKIPKPLKGIYRHLATASERILSSNADGYIFITEGLRKSLTPSVYTANRPSWVSPSGVNVARFRSPAGSETREELGLAPNDRVIGYVGVLSKERRLEDLLGLLAEAGRREPRLRLVIIGDGDAAASLRDRARAVGLEKRVRFLGLRSHSDVIRLLPTFDWGVCHLPDVTAFATSFPMKILEYRAAGLPVLASDMPAHREIAGSVAGVVIYRSAADILNALAAPPVAKADLHAFDWNTIAANFVRIYRDLISTVPTRV